MYIANNNIIQKGFSGFSLKIIALILMTMDHMHEFLASTGIPIWFNWLGRLSAPLFFFTMAEGFFYTRNRKTYVKRLYLFSIVMSLGRFISWKISVDDPSYFPVSNNIFETFFLIALNILLIEYLRDENKDLYRKIYIIFFAIMFEVVLPISTYSIFSKNIAGIIISFLPCPLLCEGSVSFVALGIIFFYLRNDRKKMMIVYAIFSVSFFPFASFSFKNIFYGYNQWIMIFAIPLMMLYNGKKGRGLKYLFYFYYPAHIFILFFLGGITHIN
ncbi:TraX family protein [Clostridium beijerinckii]|uniref:TraX family protein n=1 Tax=Clostridium beijerinckii TaxID=1520 RepID=UPI00232E3E5F|nr:TraX family protein [Clostridium beijerinckii]